jgi:hypothetical protein
VGGLAFVKGKHRPGTAYYVCWSTSTALGTAEVAPVVQLEFTANAARTVQRTLIFVLCIEGDLELVSRLQVLAFEQSSNPLVRGSE